MLGRQVLERLPEAKGVLVTAGAQGSAYCFRSAGGKQDLSGTVPVLRVSVQDTTGAGDAYLAGFLFSMVQARCPVRPPACPPRSFWPRRVTPISGESMVSWQAVFHGPLQDTAQLSPQALCVLTSATSLSPETQRDGGGLTGSSVAGGRPGCAARGRRQAARGGPVCHSLWRIYHHKARRNRRPAF